MKISEEKIIDFVYSKRLIDFLNTRTEAEKDMARIGLSHHASRTINAKKELGQTLSKAEAHELSNFKKLEKKYGFKYLGELSQEEIDFVKEDLFVNYGVLVEYPTNSS